MSKDNRLRICIGVPCYGMVPPEILDDWMRFAFHLGRRLPQYDFFIAIKTKSEQFRARNAIVEAALQAGCDYLLFLDDDMVINPFVDRAVSDCYDLVDKLLSHKKDICGVLYYHRGGECRPVLMRKTGEKGYTFLRDDEITHSLQKVDVAGGGCLLIRMAIFDHIKSPYFEPEHQWGTDIQLCRRATEAGFEVWADTSIELGHLKQERAIVTSRNRHQHQVSDTLPGEVKRQVVASDIYSRLIEDAIEFTGYSGAEDMADHANSFLRTRSEWQESGVTDPEWYRKYPKERVARQVWFNHVGFKREMTEFILASVKTNPPLSILDFGCGIGIPAFTFAERGHRVTACDVSGTGTFEFLKWRAKKHGVVITFHDSPGGLPALGSAKYDVIVAMDSIEHISQWRELVPLLADHLVEGGVLFANNAILEDDLHPEHYPIDNREFVSLCATSSLMPVNTITYVKKSQPTGASANMEVQEVVNA